MLLECHSGQGLVWSRRITLAAPCVLNDLLQGLRNSRWVAVWSCRVGMVHCEVIAGSSRPLADIATEIEALNRMRVHVSMPALWRPALLLTRNEFRDLHHSLFRHAALTEWG